MTESEGGIGGLSIRLMCMPGRHGIELPLLDAIRLLEGNEVPDLPEGWEHLPAVVFDDPITGGEPLAFYDANSNDYIPVCPVHAEMFRTSGRQS